MYLLPVETKISQVHFCTRVAYKICLEDLWSWNLQGVVDTVLLYDGWKFEICLPFLEVFMNSEVDKPVGVN